MLREKEKDCWKQLEKLFDSSFQEVKPTCCRTVVPSRRKSSWRGMQAEILADCSKWKQNYQNHKYSLFLQILQSDILEIVRCFSIKSSFLCNQPRDLNFAISIFMSVFTYVFLDCNWYLSNV